jgi:hypothetical protein
MLEEQAQDGSNFSNGKNHILSMKEEELWMSITDKMLRTDTFFVSTNTEESVNNGTSFTLMKCQKHLEKETLIQNMV